MVRDMEQRISIVTLGVSDLARARAFYEALGWRGQEVDETVFFQAGPLVLVLWARAKLAADSGVPDDGRGFDGVTLAQNVRSADEVDAVAAAAAEAGATVARKPGPTGTMLLARRDPRLHLSTANPDARVTTGGPACDLQRKRRLTVTAFKHRRRPRAARPSRPKAAVVRARGPWSGPRPRARAHRSARLRVRRR